MEKEFEKKIKLLFSSFEELELNSNKITEELLENVEKAAEVEFMRKAQNLKYKYFRMGYLINMTYREQEL